MGFADGGDSTSVSEERNAQLTLNDEITGGAGVTLNLGAPGSGQIFNAPLNEVGSKSSVGRGAGGSGSGGGGFSGLTGSIANTTNATINLTAEEGVRAIQSAAALVEGQSESALGFLDESLEFVSDQFGRILNFGDVLSGTVSGAVNQGASIGAAAGGGTPVILNNEGGIDRESVVMAAGLVAGAVALVYLLPRVLR